MTVREKMFRAYMCEVIDDEGLTGEDSVTDLNKFFATVVDDINKVADEGAKLPDPEDPDSGFQYGQ